MDPTCGEAVFLLAAAERLQALGATREAIAEQLSGVDLHGPSLDASGTMLAEADAGARLVRSDFFDLPTPAQFGDRVGWQDAVIGNPPFVRYQEHRGDARKRSVVRRAGSGRTPIRARILVGGHVGSCLCLPEAGWAAGDGASRGAANGRLRRADSPMAASAVRGGQPRDVRAAAVPRRRRVRLCCL